MRRLTTGLFALVLFAAACGSGDDAEDILVELGLSEAEAACFDREYDSRGLDMTDMLTADTDDLSTEELQTVLDVASICSGGGGAASTDSGDDDSSDDAPDDSSDDDGASGGSDERRAYDDLSLLEQAFVDGITESGGTAEVGICMLDEFEAAGISILDLAALGLDEEAQPTEEFMAAIFRCGDELAESGFFDNAGDFFSSPAEGDAYGDNPDLDALYDGCTAGDAEACDELYWTSPVGSAYEAYGNTCGDRFPDGVLTCVSAMDGGDIPDAAMNYGDDPAFDALYDACAAGDLDVCDELYLTSPIGSEYETFGSTCGGTQEERYGQCTFSDADTYGDDADLDALWDACAVGVLEACDELYITSPFGSEYEAYGSTCGQTEVEQFGQCAGAGPSAYGDDADLDALWDQCEAGDLATCDTLWLTSPIGSEYESFGNLCGGLTTENQFGSCERNLGG